MAPWWLLGLNVVVALCLSAFFYNLAGGWSVFLCVPIGYALFRFWGFVRAIVAQRGRYCLRDLLTLTCVVALLCSIYASLGLAVVFVAVLIIDTGVSCWVAAGIESAEMTRRHYWHSHPAASDNPTDGQTGSAQQDS
jgi:hypothetical protein